MIRQTYFDFLRGIAIIMVVMIHCGFNLQFETCCGFFQVVVRQILNCAVPLFFAISGYFLSTKRLETKREVFAFWKHQIPKVYIPVLIWSLPYLYLHFRGGGGVVHGLFFYLLCGFSVYYFIAVIIQDYLLLPMLQKVNRGG